MDSAVRCVISRHRAEDKFGIEVILPNDLAVLWLLLNVHQQPFQSKSGYHCISCALPAKLALSPVALFSPSISAHGCSAENDSVRN